MPNRPFLLSISAPHFTCGVTIDHEDDRPYVRRTAPIVGYMLGWKLSRVEEYCAKRRWTIEQASPR